MGGTVGGGEEGCRRGVGNCHSNLSPEPAPPASQLSCCFFCPVGTRLGVYVCRPLVLGRRGAAAGRAVWCAPPCGGDGERAGRLGSGCRLPAVLSPDGSATRIRVLSLPVPRGGMSPTVGVSAKSHAGPRQHRGLEAPSKPVRTCARTCTCARLCVHACAPPPASYTCAHACVGVCVTRLPPQCAAGLAVPWVLMPVRDAQGAGGAWRGLCPPTWPVHPPRWPRAWPK